MTTLAQVLVCLLLATAIPSYALDLGCVLSLDPCVSVDCCNDCGMAATTVDRADQAAPKFDPLMAAEACSVSLMDRAAPKLFDFPFLNLEVSIRPPRLSEPNRGPPGLSA